MNPSAHGAVHVGGLLSKGLFACSKIAATIVAATTITTGAVVVGRIAMAQSPAAQPIPVVQSAPPRAVLAQAAPATQPYSQATPVDTLSKLCAAMESNDVASIDDCLCSDGTNQDQADLGRITFEGEAAVYRIEKVWQDKFGQSMSVSGYGFDMFPGHHTFYSALRAMLDSSTAPQATIDGDTAQVRVSLPPEYFAGSGPNRLAFLGRWSGAMLVFNRVGQDWKLNTDRTINFIVSASRMSGSEDDIVHLGASIEQGVTDALNDVAGKIENGSLHTRGQAARAIQTEMGKVFQTNKVNGSNLAELPVIGG